MLFGPTIFRVLISCYTSFKGWMNCRNEPILNIKLVNTHTFFPPTLYASQSNVDTNMDRGSIMKCILQSNVNTNMDRGSIINDLIHSSGQMLCCLPCWGMTSILQLRKSASRAKAWKMPWAVHRAWLFIDWCMNYIVKIWRRCRRVLGCECP